MDAFQHRRLYRDYPHLMRGDRLTRLEARLCDYLDIGDGAVIHIDAAPPAALVLGEAPGANTSGECPMFPWPERSAGWRCMTMAGYAAEPARYLELFARANLLTTFPLDWPKKDAAESARALAAWATGIPIIALGVRVAQALGIDRASGGETHRWVDLGRVLGREVEVDPAAADQPAIWVPHPSGRNQHINNAAGRRAFRLSFTRAAAVGESRRADAAKRREAWRRTGEE